MTLLALFGPIFVVLPSPASSSIDHVTVLLPPVVICWNWPLPVVVEGEERGGSLRINLNLQINMYHVIC